MLTYELIERIVQKETSKEDIIVLRDTFCSDRLGRNAFTSALNEILDDQALHALNATIMSNAIMLNEESPNLLCRQNNEKIFKDLLVMEAKRTDMTIRFDDDNNMLPLTHDDIPHAILDHYATLQKSFYNDPKIQENNKLHYSTDVLISQSINFLLYAPILRHSKTYHGWSDDLKLKNEANLQRIDGQYITKLSDAGIASYAASLNYEPTTSNQDIQNKNFVKDNVNDIITLYGSDLKITPNTIIIEAIEKFESNSKVHLTGVVRGRIHDILSKSIQDGLMEQLNKDFYPTLVINREIIRDTRSSELEKIKKNKIFNKFAHFNAENLSILGNKVIAKIAGDDKQSNQGHSLHQKDIIDPKLHVDFPEILKELAKQPDLSQAEQKLLSNMTDTSLRMLPPSYLYRDNELGGATEEALSNYIYGTSPLHVAVYEAVTSSVKSLISNGENLNIRDDVGNTPLIYAILAEEPKEEIIKLLITNPNINLDIKNDDAQSALHIATKYNHINIVKLLLDAGANINAVNDEGDTALHLALQYHYMDMAKLLFSNSEVDIYVSNDLSLTPLQLATALVANDQALEKLMHSKVAITGHQLDIMA